MSNQKDTSLAELDNLLNGVNFGTKQIVNRSPLKPESPPPGSGTALPNLGNMRVPVSNMK